MNGFVGALITDIQTNLSTGRLNEARTLLGTLVGVVAATTPDNLHVMYRIAQDVGAMETADELAAVLSSVIYYL